MKYTKEQILDMVEEEDVEFIRLQFIDIYGNMKNMAITVSQLEKAMDNKCKFDGSAIDGFKTYGETEMFLHPDLDTFTIFPWRPQQGKVARFICDVYRGDGSKYEGDSRAVLKNAVDNAKKEGYELQVKPECEFFLFHTDDDGIPTTITHEQAGFFEVGPLDLGENARRDMVLSLEDMGFEIESSHHEKAPAQHEIDFSNADALHTADNIMTFKLTVKSIAKRHGLHATFMPKPKMGVAGSGMHTHLVLMKDGKNVFADENDELGLSKEAYYFIGGLVRRMKSMTAVANPLVNSYKRLRSGYEAPAYITWSAKECSSLIRVCASADEGPSLELRNPDSATYPYLFLALCMEAGLEGIRNQIEPPKAVDRDLMKLPEEEREAYVADLLPRNLFDAVEEMIEDEFVKRILGERIVKKYTKGKIDEWNDYCMQVSDWEIQNYLYKI